MDLENSYDLLKLCNKICKENVCDNSCNLYDSNTNLCIIRECLKESKNFIGYYRNLVVALEKYLTDHNQKTYLEDFKEKFPNAELCEDGSPSFCLNIYRKMFGLEEIKCLYNCKKCWNQIMEI